MEISQLGRTSYKARAAQAPDTTTPQTPTAWRQRPPQYGAITNRVIGLVLRQYCCSGCLTATDQPTNPLPLTVLTGYDYLPPSSSPFGRIKHSISIRVAEARLPVSRLAQQMLPVLFW